MQSFFAACKLSTVKLELLLNRIQFLYNTDIQEHVILEDVNLATQKEVPLQNIPIYFLCR